jgi:23S rRNA pseudouridine1911/1915/1917 synthase
MLNMETFYPLKDFLVPEIIAAEKDYLIVFKPPGMHTSPQADSKDPNLLDWCSARYPEIADLKGSGNSTGDNQQAEIFGRPAREGGLLHRLDYDTHGLLIICRNLNGMEAMMEQHRQRKITKEYSAITSENAVSLPGFPDENQKIPFWVFREKRRAGDSINIKSAFRPFGPGRKTVRPVLTDAVHHKETDAAKNQHDIALDGSRPYVTDILGGKILTAEAENNKIASLHVRIFRGFRHQIRCHLAWTCRPILNDSLYGGISYGKGFLGLRAYSIAFTDPGSGEEMAYSIDPLDLKDI